MSFALLTLLCLTAPTLLETSRLQAIPGGFLELLPKTKLAVDYVNINFKLGFTNQTLTVLCKSQAALSKIFYTFIQHGTKPEYVKRASTSHIHAHTIIEQITGDFDFCTHTGILNSSQLISSITGGTERPAPPVSTTQGPYRAFRGKRGILDGLGTVLKYAIGVATTSDLQTINNVIITTNSKIKITMKKVETQIKVAEQHLKTLTTITSDLHKGQAIALTLMCINEIDIFLNSVHEHSHLYATFRLFAQQGKVHEALLTFKHFKQTIETAALANGLQPVLPINTIANFVKYLALSKAKIVENMIQIQIPLSDLREYKLIKIFKIPNTVVQNNLLILNEDIDLILYNDTHLGTLRLTQCNPANITVCEPPDSFFSNTLNSCPRDILRGVALSNCQYRKVTKNAVRVSSTDSYHFIYLPNLVNLNITCKNGITHHTRVRGANALSADCRIVSRDMVIEARHAHLETRSENTPFSYASLSNAEAINISHEVPPLNPDDVPNLDLDFLQPPMEMPPHWIWSTAIAAVIIIFIIGYCIHYKCRKWTPTADPREPPPEDQTQIHMEPHGTIQETRT